jgi:hypothetical protein
MTLILTSTITCPECGCSREEEMPTDACTWFWECPACGVLLKPKSGDCCVYCSYATVPCPPVQLAGKGGCCAP